MSKYPEPAVGAFILNKHKQLLLVKTHKWTNHYAVPGGHIENGESIDEALKRELFEETALTKYKQEFLCIREFINGSEYYKKKHMLFFCYLVTINSNTIKLNDEAQEYVWVNVNEALKLNLTTDVRDTINKFILNKYK